MPYLYAYSISYCVGIVVSYILNSRFVFRQPLSLGKFLQFPAVYAIQYGLGAVILWLLVGHAAVAPELAMLVVVDATIPVTFLASRFILKRQSGRALRVPAPLRASRACMATALHHAATVRAPQPPIVPGAQPAARPFPHPV